MIGHVLDPRSPEATVDNAMALAGTIARIAGYSVGLNGVDMNALSATGIPRWVYGLGGAIAGALLFARYAPEKWLNEVRHYQVGG